MADVAGTPIEMRDNALQVADDPIIPFIEGDGIGPDIWRAAQRVFDAAAEKAYSGSKKISWTEVLAGQKAFDAVGEWLPEATVNAFRTYLVGIKGPLTTPVGGGIRSLNVTLRQTLDLYVCLRPVYAVSREELRAEVLRVLMGSLSREDVERVSDSLGIPPSQILDLLRRMGEEK